MTERTGSREKGTGCEHGVAWAYNCEDYFDRSVAIAVGASTRAHANTLAPLAQFDAAMQRGEVTKNRGEVYGHPAVDFARVTRLKSVVAECKNPLVRHVLEMICVKVARLIETPTHTDSLIDIAGYARCGVMVTDPAELKKVTAHQVEGLPCSVQTKE